MGGNRSGDLLALGIYAAALIWVVGIVAVKAQDWLPSRRQRRQKKR